MCTGSEVQVDGTEIENARSKVIISLEGRFVFSGKITQPKVADPCFPEKQQHDWRYVYVCISYWKLYA